MENYDYARDVYTESTTSTLHVIKNLKIGGKLLSIDLYRSNIKFLLKTPSFHYVNF